MYRIDIPFALRSFPISGCVQLREVGAIGPAQHDGLRNSRLFLADVPAVNIIFLPGVLHVVFEEALYQKMRSFPAYSRTIPKVRPGRVACPQ